MEFRCASRRARTLTCEALQKLFRRRVSNLWQFARVQRAREANVDVVGEEARVGAEGVVRGYGTFNEIAFV